MTAETRVHPALMWRQAWYACAFPERPITGDTFFSRQCDHCRLALAALARREPDRSIEDHMTFETYSAVEAARRFPFEASA